MTIIKPLRPTLDLLQTEALARRLKSTHLKKEVVTSKARNLRAGYNGELSLTFPLSFLPPHKFLIFYTLRLPDEQGLFQIDTLLISTNFILIIEVKNIRKSVTFDEMGQAYRIDDKVEQGFGNPVDQVKLQHLRLLRWLRRLELPSIPIEKIVVYSNPSTILKNLTNNDELPKIVMHKEKILDKIDEFSNEHPQACLSDGQLTDLSYQLLIAHTEVKRDLLNKYEVSPDQLITGVICPNCFQSPMQRKSGKWLCLSCHKSSKLAHRSALADYALLMNQYISNREAREFLQISSSNVTKQLLQKEQLEHFGVKSGRRYKLDLDHLLSEREGNLLESRSSQ